MKKKKILKNTELIKKILQQLFVVSKIVAIWLYQISIQILTVIGNITIFTVNTIVRTFSKRKKRTFLSQKRPAMWGAYALSLLLLPIAISKLRTPNRAVAAWYDSSWDYRQSAVMSNGGSPISNAKVLITLDTATLITAGKMQSDCDDIRVANSDETTLISYWVEGGCNTATTQIWAQVPTLATGSTTLYVYYGNTGAANAEMSWAGNFIMLYNNTCPSGWTRNTSFDSRFPYGASSYGGTGSADTHAHSDVSCVTGSASTSTACGGSDADIYISRGHTHTAYGSVTAASHLPPYLATVYCQNTDLSINSGLISLFDAAQPSGWTRFTALDSKFPRGASSYGATGGATTHTHTVAVTTNSGGNAADRNWGGTGVPNHSHLSNNVSSAAATNTPPYLNMVYASKDSTGTGVVNMITMASATPPIGWTRFTALDSKFPQGASTYGGTGGASTHASHNVTLLTGNANAGNGGESGHSEAVPAAHTHSCATSTTSGTNLPAYLNTIYIKRDAPDSSATASTEETAAPSEEAIAFWKFDEGYGTTANDSAKNNTGTFLSAPVWKTEDQCISGKCLAFDNVDDGVSITGQNFTSLTDYTMCSWINPKGDHKHYTGTIMSSGDWNNTHWAFGVSQTNTSIQTRKADGVNSPSWSYSFPLSQWTHVCLTRSNTTITAYANGKQVGSPYTGTTGNLISNATNTTLGRETYASGYFAFNGLLDEPKIYEVARTADQIKADYIKGAGKRGSAATFGVPNMDALSDGLIGYWNMDDNDIDSHSCVNGGSGDVCDLSGNNYHTTDVGSMTDSDYVAGKFGSALDFDGTDDYMTAGDLDQFDNLTELTACAWVNNDIDNADQYILANTPNNHRAGFLLVRDDVGYATGRTDMYKWLVGSSTDGDTYDENSSIEGATGSTTLNGWDHVCGTFRAGQVNGLTMYVNGEMDPWSHDSSNDSDTTDIDFIDATTWPFTIGAKSDGTGDFNGQLDEVRIYNRALSPGEVSDLYNWAPGPVGWWKFDENTGTTVSDISGNNNTGTLTNMDAATDWIPGKYNSGIDLDGSNDHVKISSPSFLGKNHYAWTQSGWINTVASEQAGDWRRPIQTDDYINVRYRNGSSQYECFAMFNTAGNKWLYSGTITDNTWNYITCSYDGSKFAMYVNGILKQSTSVPNDYVNDNSTDMYIGSSDGPDQYFSGMVDDVKLYDYARTPGQIIEDMNGGHPIGGSPVGSQVGYWKFDEGYGTTANNSGSTGNDDSGTISGSTWSNTGKINKALTFNGTSDYVQISDSDAVSVGTGDYTLSAWIYPTTGDGLRTIISKIKDGADKEYNLFLSSSEQLILDMETNGNNQNAGTNSLPISPNNWYHVVVTFVNSTTVPTFYLNGVEQALGSDNITVIPDELSDNLYIGLMGGTYMSNGFVGKIDEVKIYNTALTADQVKIDYNQGKAATLGSTGTDSSDAPSNSALDQYCPPGDGAACVAPVAEWLLDENTGTTANDTSGNGKTGTLTSMEETDWSPGRYGSALNFDGSNEYISVTDSGAGDVLDATNVTVEAWVKANGTQTSYANIVDKSHNATGYTGWALEFNSGGTIPYFWVGISSTGWQADATTSINDNQWHQVVGTYDGSVIKIYIDGVFEGSNNLSGSINPNNGNLAIGRWQASPSRYFNGLIDQVRVYDYARTPAQVAWSYNKGKPIGWWKLDECSGTTAYDSSGNNNNGTITIGASGSNTSAGTCTGSAGQAWYDGATGKRNASLEFDGTDDYVIDSDYVNNFSTYTISAWIKPPSSATDILITGRNDTGCAAYNLGINTSQKITFNYCNATPAWESQITSTGTFALNEWSHLAVTLDGTTATFYINGQNAGTGSFSAAPKTDETGIMIGAIPGQSNYYTGQIDDVQIYNYALTPAQVRSLYNSGVASFLPSEGSP